MSVALHKHMSAAEFLAWEDQQELRYEFAGIRPVAMTGGTIGHDDITFSLRRALDRALRGTPCRVCGPNVMIRTSDTRVRYPDALITCAPVDRTSKLANDPVVVFEVVSPSSSGTDRIVKLREYTSMPSIQRYLLLEQDAVAATEIERVGETWIEPVLSSGNTLEVPEAGIEVPLDACYEGVDMGANGPA